MNECAVGLLLSVVKTNFFFSPFTSTLSRAIFASPSLISDHFFAMGFQSGRANSTARATVFHKKYQREPITSEKGRRRRRHFSPPSVFRFGVCECFSFLLLGRSSSSTSILQSASRAPSPKVYHTGCFCIVWGGRGRGLGSARW